ncbi:fungal specific transcription factor domain-containing protein [Aspergillus melleus]|uniref:fungal specific transcription factor domain-containing protein n=1 Tax=Aspergillus melleus TaxID=138277 RepID=UPI001E8EE2D0|nr:uncharacterized protein LDX57_011569 [Aspergillus melleus]KAH8433933.1 hypothetical protein LDX57_011569 [Aspergillus melleus]
MPSVIRELDCTRSEQTKALLGAVLVVTKPHGMIFNPAWVDGLLDADTYAIYTREILSGLVLEPPSIQVVQSLLIITLHEWGSRNFHKAWVYCGIAIRIMQAIHSLRVTRYPLDTEADTRNDVMSVAIENRVFWACFIMDRMVSSGTYNPPMLPMSEMEKLGILRPLSTVEFAFGTDLASHSLGIEESLMRSEHHPTGLLDITQSFEILVSGFDIWAQVMTFILNDGRRAPGMCAPQNCPWVPGSPWSRTRSQLERWRASQHDRLYYPNNGVVAHMSLGYGESFTYSNLLYYVSTLMLHREYFPFLPLNETGPRGPVDHPTLEAEAPPGWWEESATQLFGAAEHIALLLHEASECGVSLYTPFIGFCAFSAAFNNIYVHRFPQMNLGRSLRAEQGLGYCLAYLSEFRKVCKLGDGWLATIEHSSLLYERAASDRHRYQGKTRADFDILHQSIHEFRVVDRSNDHIQEIEGAERATGHAGHVSLSNIPETRANTVDLDMPLGQLLVEASAFAHDHGAWGHWWPSLEEVDLALGLDGT